MATKEEIRGFLDECPGIKKSDMKEYWKRCARNGAKLPYPVMIDSDVTGNGIGVLQSDDCAELRAAGVKWKHLPVEILYGLEDLAIVTTEERHEAQLFDTPHGSKRDMVFLTREKSRSGDGGNEGMDRLTNIGSKGEIYITDNDDTRNIGRKEAAYKKLKEYEDLEEQGLLLRLPCRVGDTVYKVWYVPCHNGEDCPDSYGCCGCEDECDLHKEISTFSVPDISWILLHLDDIGKSIWFLTLEEAEAMLQKMRESEKAEYDYD